MTRSFSRLFLEKLMKNQQFTIPLERSLCHNCLMFLWKIIIEKICAVTDALGADPSGEI
jgi:hypothetical protein